MFWASARKGLCYTAAAYLSLAVIGTLAFMSCDTPCFGDLAGENVAQCVFITSLAHPVECLAINTTKDSSFSPPRQCLSCIVLPADFFAAGSGSLWRDAEIIAGTAAHDKKSVILLKLRI
jgi:hypothetical protein